MKAQKNFLSFNTSLRDRYPLEECFDEQTSLPSDPYPLQYIWHIWEQVKQDVRSKDYSENTRDLAPFDSVQKFWQLWSYIPQPSDLLDHKRMVRQDKNGFKHAVDALMIFKEGIKPMWEDPINSNGGHFEFRLPQKDYCAGQIDEYWNNITLGIVGGTMKGIEYVTGIRLVDKLNQGRYGCLRIEVWWQKLSPSEIDFLLKSVCECMATRLDGSIGQIPKGDVKMHGH